MTQQHPNRLIHSSSPYLRQHAHNPVDWHPWGDAAFEKAAREDKPLLVSIGYSTCHWCHVMEAEVFADAEAAALINRVCVPVKVDREERPDIDQVYMNVCQMLTGVGGWPLNIFMTADKEPFYAATYIPKRTRLGRPGVMELLPKIEEIWRGRRSAVTSSAASIIESLQSLHGSSQTGGGIEVGLLDRAYESLAGRFDQEYGGFGDGQKFPMPHHLRLLLRHWRRRGEAAALTMVEQTLQAMRAGGICDQLGFGFHRYATDRGWQLPHFEKMLYDQALIAMAYLEAYAATGSDYYGDCASEIFAYVERDLTSPEGLFYAAEDADSEGEEGLFYLWERGELDELLGEPGAAWLSAHFDVRQGGNYEEEAGGGFTGRNILYQAATDSLDAARWESARKKLLAAREQRVRPFRDEKILTDWNGLMIAALAMGGRFMAEPRYIEAAARAARRLLAERRAADGRLLHCRYADGNEVVAMLDDYAFLVWGLIELYQASQDAFFLKEARALQQLMQAEFGDRAGGYFLTAKDAEELLARPRQRQDGATPAGNSVAIDNGLRLARLTGDQELEQAAMAGLAELAGELKQTPVAYSHAMAAVDFALSESLEIVIVGDADAEDTKGMLGEVNRRFLPHAVLLLRPADKEAGTLAEVAPFTRSLLPVDGRATAYVCRNCACHRPTTKIEGLQQMLNRQE